ncbi:hypothetical protein I7X30_02180 [Capnocytophaga sp. 051621]|uniref:Uncharacterized protein n=1 Tax=Capnocytophaga periodontitidis TaxID=2795027 RepID=A0ABS0SKB2_9FLAO|nr:MULTISPECIES: hypothetical protein [Capnocytophaga]MBI1645872.1 hypothetical protein [Capnocytophaga periodontitidis]
MNLLVSNEVSFAYSNLLLIFYLPKCLIIGVGVLTVNTTYPLALYTQENNILPAMVILFKPHLHPTGHFLMSYNYV